MTLSERAIGTFAAIAETIVPPSDPGSALRESAEQLGVPQRLGDLYQLLPDDRARTDLRRLLRLLDSGLGGLLLYRRPKTFIALDDEGRAAALRRMSTSPISLVRQGFKALKTAVAFLVATRPEGVVEYPVWRAMDYPGPDGPPPDRQDRLQTIHVDRPTALTADVVIVGSGAGGGVAAGVLAAAGLDVVVLEKGGHHDESDFTHLESDALRDLYLDGGLGTTTDGGVTMLAGSTLGGGTVVNYTTSFATPEAVRRQWDEEAGFRGVFTGAGYEESSEAVHERVGVNRGFNQASTRDALMEKGLRNLGWHVDAMPRNVADCTESDCGYCGMGCRRSSKQSTLHTWLADAAAHGASILVGVDVNSVLVTDGRATGVEATANGNPVTVRARAVVLAAGALNTPAIMLRSGIVAKPVGRNLRLHPVTALWGRFEERVDPWTGIVQALYSDEFANVDGTGYGFKFETAAVHPVFPAIFFPWGDGGRFKNDMAALKHWSPIGILLRDRGSGRVKIRRDGRAAWDYRLSDYDAKHMRLGVHAAAEVLQSAGATEVVASTLQPLRWKPRQEPIESFRNAVDRVGYGMNRTTYLSFHQMGSARMGSDPSTSVIDDNNETHGLPGLFVLDASAFPTASGVNPMMSIKTIAHRGASRLAESLS